MRWGDIFQLARPRICLMVGAATAFGTLLHGGVAQVPGGGRLVCAVAVGSALVCAGCSALNQVQERNRDALMRRTRGRPLPDGRMSVGAGLVTAAAMLAAGLGLYATVGGWALLGLGLAVCAVYNGLYTPLKPVTSLALLLGGVSCAAPPLAGWLAGGGRMADPRILVVAGAFYIWQVPHFWLIAQAHARDYERAGFKPPWRVLSPGLYRPLMGVWMLAYVTAILGMAVAAPRCAPWVFALVCLGGAALVGSAVLGRGRLVRRTADAMLAAALVCLLAA